MGSGYRLSVPGDSPQSTELRLGNYISGDEGFPSNYTGSQTETTGVLMTTKGQFALVSAKPAFAQGGKDVSVQVASGGFTLKATESLTLTAKSLYLQSAEPVTATSAPPAVGEGHVTIQTDADFQLYSHDADVKVLCEEGGYSTVMTGGWLEIWGDSDDASGTETSVCLLQSVEIPIIWNFNYDSYYGLVRGAHTVLTFNESEAAVFISAATGAELKLSNIKNFLHGISTRASLLKTQVSTLVNNAIAIDFGDISFEVTEEDIMSDLTGVSNEINAAPQINTE